MVAQESLVNLQKKAENEIASASSSQALDALRVSILGKKGEINKLMKVLKDLEPEEKKEFGQALNSTKSEIEHLLENKKSELTKSEQLAKLEKEWIDVTLPVDAKLHTPAFGSLHPLTKVQRELEQIFRGLGFQVVDGPELEKEYYNFDALNIPKDHPARDMQDTFWTKAGDVLRTHTSSIQVRALEDLDPPLRIVAPGRCFRYERSDATHESTFYQMEGMMIDKHVTVGHLIYFMKTLLREIFGSEQKIRLRPGYFPFVEPGFELDIWFNNNWLELLPCGLIHPKVLEYGGIDPSKYQGFAFGLGLSRLVMSRYGIDDIRNMMGNDLRFLRQFA